MATKMFMRVFWENGMLNSIVVMDIRLKTSASTSGLRDFGQFA